jgi:putative DNA primase/helicase
MTGLEGIALACCDTIDELSEARAQVFGAAVYMLGNGSGSLRGNRDASLRETATFRLQFISVAENSIAQKIAEDTGKRAKAGQLARILDIPIVRDKFGAFDSAGPDGDAGKLAQQFSNLSLDNYGHAGPELVRIVIQDMGVDQARVRYQALVDAFVTANTMKGDDGQWQSAVKRLALGAAALELAIERGLLPGWEVGLGNATFRWGLKQWSARRGGRGSAEETGLSPIVPDGGPPTASIMSFLQFGSGRCARSWTRWKQLKSL